MKKLISILSVLFYFSTINLYSASKILSYRCGFEESEGYGKASSTILNSKYIKDWKLTGTDIVKNTTLEGNFSLVFVTNDTKKEYLATLRIPFTGISKITFQYSINKYIKLYYELSTDSTFNNCISNEILYSYNIESTNEKIEIDVPVDSNAYYIRIKSFCTQKISSQKLILDNFCVYTQNYKSMFKEEHITNNGNYLDFINEIKITQLSNLFPVENKKINYLSSDTAIANIDNNGIVSIKKHGESKITAFIDIQSEFQDTISYSLKIYDYKSNIIDPDYELLPDNNFKYYASGSYTFSKENNTGYTKPFVPTDGNIALILNKSNILTSPMIDISDLYLGTFSIDLGVYLVNSASYKSGIKTNDSIMFSISYDGGIKWHNCFSIKGNSTGPFWSFNDENSEEFLYSITENNKPDNNKKYSKISIRGLESSENFKFKITTAVKESDKIHIALDNIKIFSDSIMKYGSSKHNPLELNKYSNKGICSSCFINKISTSYINDTISAICNSLKEEEELIIKTSYRKNLSLPLISQLFLNYEYAVTKDNLSDIASLTKDNKLILSGIFDYDDYYFINNYIENHSNIEALDIRTIILNGNKLSLNRNTTSVLLSDLKYVNKQDFKNFDGNTLLYMPYIENINDEIYFQNNVIIGDTAIKIQIEHLKPFYPFSKFHAKEINYTRSFKPAHSSGSGWETIALPFDVEKVYGAVGDINNPEIEIKSFAHGQLSGANFWVRTFTDADNSSLFFIDTDTIQRNTPYIIAMPGPGFGAENILSDRVITFSASNQDINNIYECGYSKNIYNFGGYYDYRQSHNNCYPLNNSGSIFVLENNYEAKPFTPLFTLNNTPEIIKRVLPIVNSVPQSIKQVHENKNYIITTNRNTIIINKYSENINIYDTTGRFIRKMDKDCRELSLPKGYYIVKAFK